MDFDFDIKNNSLEIMSKFKSGSDLNKQSVRPKADSRVDCIDFISGLPDELYLEIFKHLNLTDLMSCTGVSWRWRRIAVDHSFYTDRLLENVEISRNPNEFIFFFKNYRWLRNLTIDIFRRDDKTTTFLNCFLEECGQQLTTLEIYNGMCFNHKTLQLIGKCEELNVLFIKNVRFNSNDYIYLSMLKKLVTLNLSRIYIDDDTLIIILKNNPNLEHIIMDIGSWIQNLNKVLSAVARYNKKLMTWSSRAVKCTTNLLSLFAKFSKCVNLKELNVKFGSHKPLLQSEIEISTLKCLNLKKLVIWGDLIHEDETLFYILRDLKMLKHLEICYNMNISEHFFNLALRHFSHLENLVVYFVDNQTVELWKSMYPGVTIKNIFYD